MADSSQQHIPESDHHLLDRNLFMMCRSLNRNALRTLPHGYHLRYCREDELDIWKAMPFDDPTTANTYRDYMTAYFSTVYAGKDHLFYEKCVFVCDTQDRPIATAFIWKAYDAFSTVHWLKVVKSYEGRGIGRALLSVVMHELKAEDYPVYLHTQPGSYRAIKLYTDFGFALLLDPIIGQRENDVESCLPVLKTYMTSSDFKQLRFAKAPDDFLRKLAEEPHDEF